MKKILIGAIGVYQAIFSSILNQIVGTRQMCRFETTCSEYAKKSIYKKGVLMGSYLSVIRIMRCQPFYQF